MRERNYALAQKSAKTSRGDGESNERASRPVNAADEQRRPVGDAGPWSRQSTPASSRIVGVAPGPRETNPRAEAKPLTTTVGGRTAGLIPATGAKPKVGRPRIEDRDKTLAALKPWCALGMSESTWRRRLRLAKSRQAEQRGKP